MNTDFEVGKRYILATKVHPLCTTTIYENILSDVIVTAICGNFLFVKTFVTREQVEDGKDIGNSVAENDGAIYIPNITDSEEIVLGIPNNNTKVFINGRLNGGGRVGF